MTRLARLIIIVWFSWCAYVALCARLGHGLKSPSTGCGPNQIEDCVFSCPPEKTCSTRHAGVNCPDVEEPCTLRCVCKPGYVRNYLDDCIPEQRCDECAGAHEFFSCGGACDNECATISSQNRTSCPIQNVVCNPRCYCEDGFVRDSRGICVSLEQCPPAPSCTGPYEQYTVSKRPCPPQTCVSLVAFFKCDSNQPTESGCVCKPGFLRQSEDSPCVPTCECPQMQTAPECQGGRY